MSSQPTVEQQQEYYRQELQRCSKDFLYFLTKYLKIVDKDANVLKFKPKPAQVEAIADFMKYRRIFTLKGRQIGYSTIYSAHGFWRASFGKNIRVGVLAHTLASCREIFSIYQNYRRYLPAWMKQAIPTIAANANEIAFAHGSKIKVMTHSTMGGTYQYLHASEFAHYRDIKASMTQVFQMVGRRGQIVLETTSNGQNEACELWNGTTTYGGKGAWRKRFIAWYQDPEYQEKKPLKRDELTEKEIEYVKEIYREVGYKLSLHQMAWCRAKVEEFGGSWALFNRTYPGTPELAFITAGVKFFNRTFPYVTIPEGYEDYQEWEPPDPYAKYMIGVDTASGDAGPDSDYHAFVVLKRLKDNKGFEQVAGYRGNMPLSEYSDFALDIAKRYNAFAIIEANNYGLTVLNRFIEDGYPWMFKRVQYDKGVGRVTSQYGIYTSSANRMLVLSRLQQYLHEDAITICDPRLMREINGFEYKTADRAEANKESKDDLVLAASFALQGIDQSCDYEESRNFTVRPRGARDIMAWEIRTGRLYDPDMPFDDDTERIPGERYLDASPGEIREFLNKSVEVN